MADTYERLGQPVVSSPSTRVKWMFWTLVLALAIIAAVVGIELVGYRTIPAWPFKVDGDPIIVFDPEIGFVPSRQASSLRSDYYPDGRLRLQYHLYTDQRGARVSRPGESTPDHADVVFIGDSFTWGHGIEGADTFAYGVGKRLATSTENLSMGSYGTTHSLQLLRRNLDLAPRLIVYSFIDDHLRRNVHPCAPSYYPFCLDQAHVAWSEGRPAIAPPFSNGVRRIYLHLEAQQRGLWPPAWIVHGLDIALGKILFDAGNKDATDPDKQKAALEFLLGEMSNTARSINANLLIVYIPMVRSTAPPAALRQSVASLGVEFPGPSASVPAPSGGAAVHPERRPSRRCRARADRG